MARSYSQLLPEIYSFQNLHEAYLKARKGKRMHAEVLAFSRTLESNLIEIQNELMWGSYRQGKYYFFEIREPKTRLVAALPFRDRVVQHAINTIIEPLWERRFISDSYACRPMKGTHAGADRVQSFVLRTLRKYGHVYCLKADIRKYFPSIDHGVLKKLIRKRIACSGTLSLLDGIIDSAADDGDLSPRGIPIGNLTSQLFANIYLHELDLFVKHALREPLYVRYMDDFVVIHHDKSHLHAIRRDVEWFLGEVLRLQTNSKTQVFPVAKRYGRSVDFLGYRIWPYHRKLRRDSVKRMHRRLRELERLYRDGKIDLRGVDARVQSWLGHAKHANTYGLKKKLLGEVGLRRVTRD